MSMNLHLCDPKRMDLLRSPLVQTPSVVTRAIMEKRTKRDRLRAYFNWLERDEVFAPGALLDHKLVVLLHMIDNPRDNFISA